ncbi:uncharacterized protein LOC132458195 isoform X1 [Gadus macrocephalus]|uniref:uncharacterized protein LOC132458195 isoform X1 n=1 Tax=Gadus macrocephalus TaxID=80720 RepID=UPI0028CB6790|nr:uncharacterized protein LOC132458195 isoform X1 [Gadus macrocephalus]
MPPRRKGHLRPVNSGSCSNSVEELAFRYMEMCKVESSTDESDNSPRSSDTSTMALVTNGQEKIPLPKNMSSWSHKVGGRLPCYCRYLDPYDGSSEDSDESRHAAGLLRGRPRQHGCARSHFLCRSRRLVPLQPPASAPLEVTKREPRARPPPSSTTTTTTTGSPLLTQQAADVLMDSDGSSSELWVSPRSPVSGRRVCRDPAGRTGSGHGRPEGEDDRFEDSGLHSAIRSPTPPPCARSPPRTAGAAGPSGPSDRSPGPSSDGCCLYKRKMMGPHVTGVGESGQRKRQCVVSMKEEPG